MGPHVSNQPVSVRVCTGLSSVILGDRAVAPKFMQHDFIDQTWRYISLRAIRIRFDHTGSPIMQPRKSKPTNPMLVARPEGFEPPTPGSEDQCSNPLSYGRIKLHECTGA